MLKQRTYITWLVRFALLGAIAALLAAAPTPTPAPNAASNHKEPYKESQCDDAPSNSNDPQKGQRESPCGLEFGTSSGAMGIRKFPNPRFDLAKWKQVNGGDLTSWKGFDKEVKPEIFHSKLRDGSIEPPFY